MFTDSSNASRTMLMDLATIQWSDHMLKEFGIKKETLPEIKLSSSDDYGRVSTVDCLNGV
jgi:glycerol kinase